jgi:hypothetical protein
MSKQVRLTTLQFTNLDMLKKSIVDEGLRVTDSMRNYGSKYTAGMSYGRGKEFVMGIDTGGHANMGVVKNVSDGTYELVGDTYDAYQLEDLSAHVCQRYRINQVVEAAAATGWEIVVQPSTMLKAHSKEKMRMEIKEKRKIAIGMMA